MTKPNISLTLGGIVGLAILAVGGFLIAYYWKDLKSLFGEKLNPFSDKNVAYEGVNKIVQMVPGLENESLGTAVYTIQQKAQNLLKPADTLYGTTAISDANLPAATRACIARARAGYTTGPTCREILARAGYSTDGLGDW